MIKPLAIAAGVLMTAAPCAAMPICDDGPRITCVVDGDTFWLAGEKIRIVNIDAPELGGARCAAERARAIAATRWLADQLAEPISIERTGIDRYGRTLARVSIAGVDIGGQLIAAGFAKPWHGAKARWCG